MRIKNWLVVTLKKGDVVHNNTEWIYFYEAWLAKKISPPPFLDHTAYDKNAGFGTLRQ